ncbi:hypothetical protein GCM10008019_35890 [Deinococcus soli (ex Cha et al. 2016)]|nr:hypothetical protein GCM10008019_35890 [Deinococcus soli (ex Cha et al. 2016)]
MTSTVARQGLCTASPYKGPDAVKQCLICGPGTPRVRGKEFAEECDRLRVADE